MLTRRAVGLRVRNSELLASVSRLAFLQVYTGFRGVVVVVVVVLLLFLLHLLLYLLILVAIVGVVVVTFVIGFGTDSSIVSLAC